MNELIDTPRLLNRAAMKAYALKCSKQTRAGKFERVGQDFLDAVEADLDTFVRGLSNATPIPDGFRPVETDAQFVTNAMAQKLNNAMNGLVARIIQRRVHRHPTVGVTLKG